MPLMLFLYQPVLGAPYSLDVPAQEQGTEWQTENGVLEELDGPPAEDIVYDEAEFLAWCYAHSDSGGIVYLGAAITLTERHSIYNSGYITIDTGAYGLIYDGGYIFSLNCEIIGEGVDIPVLSIYNANCFRDSWETSVLEEKITATGRGGIGGTAVCVYAKSSYSFNFNYLTGQGLISSFGTGAIGLYVNVPMDVHCLNIAVDGDNSTAIYAPEGVNLYYCKLSASGAGATTVSGDGILLDTCATSPAPEGVNVINRQIIGMSGSGFYIPVSEGDSESYQSYITDCYTLLLSGSDEYLATTLFAHVVWDDALDKIDVETLGTTIIKGQLQPVFQGLGLENGDFPLELILEVRDPALPCIYMYWLWLYDDYGEEAHNHISLYFWDSYNPEDGDVILWRSDDEGATWYDFTDSEALDWWGNGLDFYYGEIAGSIQLKIEVPNKGESNIVSITMMDGMAVLGCGGDRTGTDRNGVDTGNSNAEDNDRMGTQPDDSSNTGSGTDNDNGGGTETNSDSGDLAGTQQDSYTTVQMDSFTRSILSANNTNAAAIADLLLNTVQAEAVFANTGDSPKIAETPVAVVETEDTLLSIDTYDSLDTLLTVGEAQPLIFDKQSESLKNINVAMAVAASASVLLVSAFVWVRLRKVNGK